MDAARAPVPARDTGLPPGVKVGPLGRRLVAYVVDSVVPAVAVTLVLVARGSLDGTAATALTLVGVLLGLAWAALCWQQLALRAATPGMRATKVQLVGFLDGRPVGWGRAFLRWLVFTALSSTGLGLLLLLGSVLVSVRHQGWHDRAVGGVVIVERPLPPRRTTARPAAPQAAPRDEPAPAPRAQAAPAPAPRAQAAPAPATAPAVAADPAIGPELTPLAGAPVRDEADADGRTVAATTNGHRTIYDGWVAELDDGREIAVRGLVLLGRNPQPDEGEADAELVKLPDESRTVSKTHLALGVDDAGLFVVDRGSTNGSTVTPPGRPTTSVGAFHAVPVSEGSVVSIGDHWVRIRRVGG